MAEHQGYYDTHEVPTYKYLYIAGVAIHKEFFMWWTGFTATFTLAATLVAVYTDWWQTLIAAVLTWLYIQNPIIGVPATLATAVTVYLWWHYRQKRLKRERVQKERARRIQEIMLGGGEQKRKR